MGFDIDWQSAGIGYGAGLLTGYALYQSRHVLNAIRRAVTSQADSAQSFATMGGDRRYTNELTKYSLRGHLFYDAVDLNDLLIEPRFIPDRNVLESADEDNERLNPLDLIPIVPDYPYLHQPYKIKTFNVEELGHGERAVALLGLPGSGRTTTLLSIALWSMGKIDFDAPEDPVQERLKEEAEGMSRQDRDEQEQARVAIEQRAREQLREEMGRDVHEEMDSAFIPPFRRMAPIYVHLANVRLGNRAWNGNVDPAEPLIRALQYQTGRITSKTMPRKIYNFLNEGVCLLLLDGLDTLPHLEQQQKIAWLHALLDEYNQNFIIVATSPRGFGGLQQIGFTPIHLRPWTHQDAKKYILKMGNHWNKISNQRRVEIDEEQQQQILDGLWGLNPFEITMKVQAQLADNEAAEIEDFAGWTRQHLANTFDDAEDAMPMLARAANQQLDNHFFTLNEWVDTEIAIALNDGKRAINTDAMAKSFDDDLEAEFGAASLDADEDEPFERFDPENDDSFGAFDDDEDEDFSEFEDSGSTESGISDEFGFSDEEVNEEEADEEEPKDETKEARQVRRTVGKLLSTLVKTGLVERYYGNRYRFRQSYIASYLASLTLLGASEETFAQKATHPQWAQAIAYAASQMDITAAVETKMQNPTDILHTNILDVAYWLRYADELTEWRNKYLGYLGQMFVSPSQYLTNRERIAAALVTTRDLNARKVFGRGTQNNNMDVQRLSLLALGTYQQEDLMHNISAFLDAQQEEIRVAAAFAITNIHTEEAHELLKEELMESGSESVMQVIAEAFADNTEVGHEILWDILHNEEYKDKVRLRRAAILGIQQMRTEWSLIEIYRTYVDSEQWYVKSTAQVAFTERQSQQNKGAPGYPQITTLPWLREWSLNLEDEEAAELSGTALLNMAMRESDPVIRFLATANSGQLAVYENAMDLYQLLNDPEDVIRDTAYRALVDLQLRMGQPLPIPR